MLARCSKAGSPAQLNTRPVATTHLWRASACRTGQIDLVIDTQISAYWLAAACGSDCAGHEVRTSGRNYRVSLSVCICGLAHVLFSCAVLVLVHICVCLSLYERGLFARAHGFRSPLCPLSPLLLARRGGAWQNHRGGSWRDKSRPAVSGMLALFCWPRRVVVPSPSCLVLVLVSGRYCRYLTCARLAMSARTILALMLELAGFPLPTACGPSIVRGHATRRVP